MTMLNRMKRGTIAMLASKKLLSPEVKEEVDSIYKHLSINSDSLISYNIHSNTVTIGSIKNCHEFICNYIRNRDIFSSFERYVTHIPEDGFLDGTIEAESIRDMIENTYKVRPIDEFTIPQPIELTDVIECPVCRESSNKVFTCPNCRGTICHKCLVEVLSRTATCPICTAKLV